MERVFSVEEIPGPFWAPPPPEAAAGGVGAGVGGGGAMDRCPSEWYLQKFLEEAVVDRPAAGSPSPAVVYPSTRAEAGGRRGRGEEVVEAKPAATAASAVGDPVQYNAMLKQKLEKDLAAVAMWRASGAMLPESSLGDSVSPNSDGSNLGSQNYMRGNRILVQNKFGGGPSGGPGPHLVQHADGHVKQATSSSSREPSDDDDMEGEAETIGNMNPSEEKMKRRKESNRESARRSRSRKAAHLKELEEKVAQLRVENSSLLRRLADVNQKYNNAAVDNRVLKADVETLRAKVKMAEDTVKRVTGMSPLFPAVSDMSSLSIPFNGSPSDATSDAAVVPIQGDPNNYFATANEVGVNNTYMPEVAPTLQVQDTINGALTAANDVGVNNTYMPEVAPTLQVQDTINRALTTGKMDRTASLQRAARLEHLQKKIRGRPTSPGPVLWEHAPLDPNELLNMKMQ